MLLLRNAKVYFSDRPAYLYVLVSTKIKRGAPAWLAHYQCATSRLGRDMSTNRIILTSFINTCICHSTLELFSLPHIEDERAHPCMPFFAHMAWHIYKINQCEKYAITVKGVQSGIEKLECEIEIFPVHVWNDNSAKLKELSRLKQHDVNAPLPRYSAIYINFLVANVLTLCGINEIITCKPL